MQPNLAVRRLIATGQRGSKDAALPLKRHDGSAAPTVQLSSGG